jgi:hypothetical protein
LFSVYEFSSLKKYLSGNVVAEAVDKAPAFSYTSATAAEVLKAAKISGKVGLVLNGTRMILSADGQVSTVILSEAKNLLEDAGIAKYGVDLKRTDNLLASEGIALNGQWNDIQLMHYVLNPERSHELAALAQTYLGVSLEDSAPATTGSLFDDAPEEEDSPRLLEAAVMVPLGERLRQELPSIYDQMDEPLAKVLAQMERDGVKYNLKVYGGDTPLPKKVWRLLMKTYYKRFHAKYKRGVFSDETKGGIVVQFLKYLHYLTIKKFWFYTKHDSHSIPELPNSRICVLWNGDEGDEMISFLCGFLTHDKKIYSLPRLAINEKYNYYTPGCILMAEVLKYLKEGGETEHLDMSRGDEQYKFKMGAIGYSAHDIVLK